MSLTKVSYSMIEGATVNIFDYPGADTGTKLINAITALPATGGVVDCRGLMGDQTISSTVEIGSTTRPVTVLCSHNATFKPSTASVQMFRIRPNGQLVGATIDTTNVTYAAQTILINDSFNDGQSTLIQDIVCNGKNSEGIAIALSTSGTTEYGIVYVTLNKIRTVGYYVGVNVEINNANQYINSNIFSDIEVKGGQIGFNYSGNGDFRANQSINCSFQASPTSAIGFNILQGLYNTWLNTNIWDMPAAGNEIVFGVLATRNVMAGYLNAINIITNNGNNTIYDIVTGNIPVYGEIQVNNVPINVWGINFASSAASPNLITLANNATYNFAVGSGLMILQSTATGAMGIFTSQAQVVYKFNDETSSYTATAASAGKTNCYYSAGAGLYQIENKTGGTVSYYVSLIKTKLNN